MKAKKKEQKIQAGRFRRAIDRMRHTRIKQITGHMVKNDDLGQTCGMCALGLLYYMASLDKKHCRLRLNRKLAEFYVAGTDDGYDKKTDKYYDYGMVADEYYGCNLGGMNLKRGVVSGIINLNDTYKWSFADIANAIEVWLNQQILKGKTTAKRVRNTKLLANWTHPGYHPRGCDAGKATADKPLQVSYVAW